MAEDEGFVIDVDRYAHMPIGRRLLGTVDIAEHLATT